MNPFVYAVERGMKEMVAVTNTLRQGNPLLSIISRWVSILKDYAIETSLTIQSSKEAEFSINPKKRLKLTE